MSVRSEQMWSSYVSLDLCWMDKPKHDMFNMYFKEQYFYLILHLFPQIIRSLSLNQIHPRSQGWPSPLLPSWMAQLAACPWPSPRHPRRMLRIKGDPSPETPPTLSSTFIAHCMRRRSRRSRRTGIGWLRGPLGSWLLLASAERRGLAMACPFQHTTSSQNNPAATQCYCHTLALHLGRGTERDCTLHCDSGSEQTLWKTGRLSPKDQHDYHISVLAQHFLKTERLCWGLSGCLLSHLGSVHHHPMTSHWNEN